MLRREGNGLVSDCWSMAGSTVPDPLWYSAGYRKTQDPGPFLLAKPTLSSRLVVMSTQFGTHNPGFDPDSLTTGDSPAKSVPDQGASDAFGTAVAALRAGLHDKRFDPDVFVNQVAHQARHSTGADSTVVALRRGAEVVCLARSGPTGPTLGAPLDSRSGISGECLRRGVALRCEDSEKDPRVDAEVCRRLGIRSVLVVPVFEGSQVVGLLEAFSSRPSAFQDQHVLILERLASLTGESKSRVAEHPGSSFQQISSSVKANKESTAIPDSALSEERRRRWTEAFSFRPYQIAIVAGFLLLDLLTIYWWQR
jgi:L-methionine (R)-S-oxide reductase